MKNFRFYSIVIAIVLPLFLISCSTLKSQETATQPTEQTKKKDLSNLSTAYFASGCFWCVEAVYESVKGVEEAVSGYEGGQTDNPTYRAIGTGKTGHAETVEVYYDAEVVSYESLLKVFFGSGDPTTLNKQGPDRGTQYRSAIFYKNEEEKQQAEKMISQLTADKVFENSIVTEVTKHTKFYKAEDYHQDYEKLNPSNPYVRSVSIPRLKRFQAKFPELLK